MKTAKVTLDGEVYTITELRSRANATWRSRLEEEFEDLAMLIEAAPQQEVTDAQGLANLVRSVSGKLINSVDILRELTVEYAPELAEPLDEAYDSEMLDVFTAVLGLAYPFGGLISRLGELGAGSGGA